MVAAMTSVPLTAAQDDSLRVAMACRQILVVETAKLPTDTKCVEWNDNLAIVKRAIGLLTDALHKLNHVVNNEPTI